MSLLNNANEWVKEAGIGLLTGFYCFFSTGGSLSDGLKRSGGHNTRIRCSIRSYSSVVKRSFGLRVSASASLFFLPL